MPPAVDLQSIRRANETNLPNKHVLHAISMPEETEEHGRGLERSLHRTARLNFLARMPHAEMNTTLVQ